MKILALAGPALASALAACSGISPSTLESRHIPFPLPACTEHMLGVASDVYTSHEGVEYNKNRARENDPWVCVTRTYGKREFDKANPETATSSGHLDASFGPHYRALKDGEDKGAATSRGEHQAYNSQEEMDLRKAIETPYIRAGAPLFGVALSGGGSKAGSFAIGVMAGLADLDLLDSASYISSVSGGSYAAYFYYAHKIFPMVPKRAFAGEPPTTGALFHDCVRLPSVSVGTTGSIRSEIQAHGDCTHDQLTPSRKSEEASKEVMYQALLRCQQDLLNPGICSVASTGEDVVGISSWALISNILTAPLSLVSNTIFDWGLVTSPSSMTYRDGIGLAYGTSPINIRPLMDLGKERRVNWLGGVHTDPADLGRIENTDLTMPVICSSDDGTQNPRAYARDCRTEGPNNATSNEMNFEELRQGLLAAKNSGKPLPFWIINAVATKSRSSLGWWTVAGKFNTNSSDVFEMTPVSHGSGRYGYVPASMYFHGFTVLDAVAASAAFFDPNQNALGGSNLRGPLGVAQRLGNFDWGKDISNYNVSDARRTFHTSIPFPVFDSFYARHVDERGQPEEDVERVGSVFIRLIDGGNGENLGAYSLLKRGVRNVVISDAAHDAAGSFSDICEARRRVMANHLHLYVPGLRNLNEHCGDLEDRKEERSYGVHEWPFDFPVLLGCVRAEDLPEDGAQCNDLGESDNRIFIVKPAINVTAFARHLTSAPDRPGNHAKYFRQINECTMPNAAHRVPEPLNCETSIFLLANLDVTRGHCQVFPQHSTVTDTANSSHLIFAAYRELGRQYIKQAGPMLKALSQGEGAAREFEKTVQAQYQADFEDRDQTCKRENMLQASASWPMASSDK